MASLYKNNGIWYIAVIFNGNRKCKSLKTKNIKVSITITLSIYTYKNVNIIIHIFLKHDSDTQINKLCLTLCYFIFNVSIISFFCF